MAKAKLLVPILIGSLLLVGCGPIQSGLQAVDSAQTQVQELLDTGQKVQEVLSPNEKQPQNNTESGSAEGASSEKSPQKPPEAEQGGQSGQDGEQEETDGEGD